MSNTPPLAGLIQFTAGTLRDYATKYAEAVDADLARFKTETPERIKRLYQLRPDLAAYRYKFFGIPAWTETVFHEDGRIEKCEDWYENDRRKVYVLRACNLPTYGPKVGHMTGHEWLDRLKGLSGNAVVFINADDSGTLTSGYTPFPEFCEDTAKRATRID